MRGADDGRAAAGHVAEEAADRDRGLAVEACRRLVGEQERRPRRERPGDGDALPLPAREPAEATVGQPVQATLSSAAPAPSGASPRTASAVSTVSRAVSRSASIGCCAT